MIPSSFLKWRWHIKKAIGSDTGTFSLSCSIWLCIHIPREADGCLPPLPWSGEQRAAFLKHMQLPESGVYRCAGLCLCRGSRLTLSGLSCISVHTPKHPFCYLTVILLLHLSKLPGERPDAPCLYMLYWSAPFRFEYPLWSSKWKYLWFLPLSSVWSSVVRRKRPRLQSMSQTSSLSGKLQDMGTCHRWGDGWMFFLGIIW